MFVVKLTTLPLLGVVTTFVILLTYGYFMPKVAPIFSSSAVFVVVLSIKLLVAIKWFWRQLFPVQGK